MSRTPRWSAGLFTLLAIVLVPQFARADLRPLTPHDVARIQTVSASEISPDGTHVAYVLSVPRVPGEGEDGANWTHLRVFDISSGADRPYITGKVNVSQVAWTPDGEFITYVSKRGDDESAALYAIPVHGGESRRLLSHKAGVGSYTFSPDLDRVAFTAAEPVTEEREKEKEQGFDQEVFEEDLRFVKVHIAEVDWSGEEITLEPRTLELTGSASLVRWSPVDDRLVMGLAPSPLTDHGYMYRKLGIVDAVTSEVLATIETEGKLTDVRWSPDGTKLAIIGPDDVHDPSAGRLFVATDQGGLPKEILPNYMGHVRAVRWADKNTVAFVGDESVWTTLNTIRHDGSKRKVLDPTGGPVLSGLSISADGKRMAMRGSSPEFPTEVMVYGAGKRAMTRATNSNPWLSEIQLAKQEVVTYEARDGLELEGILFRPLNERDGQRYPLILAVHGGPEAHRRMEWLTFYQRPGQWAASEDIAVFYPNYRGSTGRGVEFSKLSQGDPAGKEFDDVVDAIDHFVDSGLVDPDKVGVTGGSYGGYATAWCSTYYSEKFAAGVMFVGISDNIAKFGTTDIADESLLVHQRSRVYDDWDFFRDRSPIYHADKHQTPLLILHGKKDARVHYGQSLAMYRHLKTRNNAPVRLVLYPNERHGNRKAAAKLDYNLRALRWMVHYLKGEGGEMPAFPVDYGLEPEVPTDMEATAMPLESKE